MADTVDMLRRPVRPAVWARHLGRLLVVLAGLVTVPLLVSLRFGETGLALRHGVVLALLGVAGALLGRIHAPRRVRTNEAMVVAASIFLVTPLLMTVAMTGYGLGFVDALFESVSGVTTTGLSVVPQGDGEPASFHFLRAWMQWFGGLGVVVLALALVVQPGTLGRRLALTESFEDDLVGGTGARARKALITYCAITGVAAATLWLLGANGFEAIVYALTSVSTGGFSPHGDSLLGLGGWTVRAAVILFCLAGAAGLVWFQRLARGDRRAALRDPQVRALLVFGALATGTLFLTMGGIGDLPWLEALEHAPLMALSAQTTAGFSSVDPASLDGASKLLLILSMSVGGAAGSTAGGIKLLRVLVLLRVVHGMVIRTGLPKHAVFEPRLGGHQIERSEIQEAMLILLLFFGVALLSWLAFLVAGYAPLDALFDVVSATGTVGLSTGVTDASLPTVLKLVLCVDMLMGRLELIPLLVLAYPRTWLPAGGRTT